MIEIKNVTKTFSKLKSIKKVGKAPVYDITVQDTHRILANGFYTSNCNHPEIETFINIKRDKIKVTGANVSIKVSDEFMNAVERNEKFTLQWPVDVPVEQAKVIKIVNAKDIWDQIIDAAWYAAEPGLFFWNNVENNTPSQIYKDLGYKTIASNPCVTGETLIAVADGRNYVSIKQLANEEKDVLTYAYDNNTNKLVIKKMRHPRLTGKNMPVYCVTTENGHTFKATGNHELFLIDGTKKRVDELKYGDQLWTAYKLKAKFNEVLPCVNASTSQDYFWIKENDKKSWRSEHREIWQAMNDRKMTRHEVIHHSDFNACNNSIENLILMSKKEHDEFHAVKMRGHNNPVWKIKADPIKYKQFINKLSDASKGLNNARAFDVSNEELILHIRSLTIKLQRRISPSDWHSYAQENNLPRNLNEFRAQNGACELFSQIAKEENIKDDLINIDPRMARHWVDAEKQGYVCRLHNNKLEVERVCEYCQEKFWTRYSTREFAFCSSSCSQRYTNTKEENKLKRYEQVNRVHSAQAKITRSKILDLYTQLRLEFGRDPIQNELVKICQKNKISFRYKLKYGFKNWQDVKEQANLHNHRVISVDFVGYEDVYNGTVDDVHTMCIALGTEKLTQFNNDVTILIASPQCGEIPLSSYDSCRLQVIDLRRFIINPWIQDAKFDFDKLDQVTQIAQRLMDDLVDLELEVVDNIIEKIKSDPENIEIKQVEINLWNKIKQAGQSGRRTGLGVTGFADALAMLGIKYGSQESIEMTDKIYQALALGSYRSSVKMAEERGSFPIWDYDLEKDHEFLNRIFSLDEDLKQRWQKFGRRNIANTTTAPVGSLSTVLRCSSGIEPVFMLGYDRRRKINASDTTSKVDFIDDLGDKWQQYTMYHHGVKDWMKATGETDIKKSPYFGGTSSDVDWETGVKIQSTAQRFVCHAISRTANLPREATHKTISDIYMNAWKSGCKGFTVYRDGCRSGVLLTGKESNNWFNKIPDEELNEMIAIGEKFSSNMSGVYLSFITSAKKELNNRHNVLVDDCNHTSQIKHVLPRPKKLPCDLHRIKVMTNGESETYLVLVGLNDKIPYEMFCGLADHITLPKKLTKGFIIKNGKKLGCTTYNLMLPIAGCDEEGIMFNDIVELFANRTYGAFSRQLSLGLRHQIPIHYIVEQLLKDKQSDMTSFNRVIARVLKTYIPDGTKVNSDKVCPECKQESMIYSEGCVKCVSCGFSKCG